MSKNVSLFFKFDLEFESVVEEVLKNLWINRLDYLKYLMKNEMVGALTTSPFTYNSGPQIPAHVRH